MPIDFILIKKTCAVTNSLQPILSACWSITWLKLNDNHCHRNLHCHCNSNSNRNRHRDCQRHHHHGHNYDVMILMSMIMILFQPLPVWGLVKDNCKLCWKYRHLQNDESIAETVVEVVHIRVEPKVVDPVAECLNIDHHHQHLSSLLSSSSSSSNQKKCWLFPLLSPMWLPMAAQPLPLAQPQAQPIQETWQ